MIDLTAFQQLALLVVSIRERQHGDRPHGLAIKEDLTELYEAVDELDEDEEVNHGRLYPNLDKLVDRGLLEKGERDDRTNWYGLTDDGADAIRGLASLIHVARGKDMVNPYVPTSDRLNPEAETTADD